MSRKELIIDTARSLIVRDGLHDTSIGKIAKAANIPVGSVYTYFEGKEDLLNHIYHSIKLEMSACVFSGTEADLDLKDELKLYWMRAVAFGLQNEEKFYFIEQFSNSPIISKAGREEIDKEFARVFYLFEKGIREKRIKPLDLLVLHSLVNTNMIGVIKYLAQNPQQVSTDFLESLYECCWDSIRIV